MDLSYSHNKIGSSTRVQLIYKQSVHILLYHFTHDSPLFQMPLWALYVTIQREAWKQVWHLKSPCALYMCHSPNVGEWRCWISKKQRRSCKPGSVRARHESQIWPHALCRVEQIKSIATEKWRQPPCGQAGYSWGIYTEKKIILW